MWKRKKTDLNESLFLRKIDDYEKIINYFLHEVSNPLHNVNFHLETLRENLKKDKSSFQAIEELANTFNTIEALHVVFSELVRGQVGDLTREIPELNNLNSLAEFAIHISKIKLNSSVRFKRIFASNSMVFCNKNEIIHAICQIIKNSIELSESSDNYNSFVLKTDHFTDDTGTMYSMLEVISYGAIPPKYRQADIFNPNFTINANASNNGLLMAKQLIEKNHGKIVFHSGGSLEKSAHSGKDYTIFKILLRDRKTI